MRRGRSEWEEAPGWRPRERRHTRAEGGGRAGRGQGRAEAGQDGAGQGKQKEIGGGTVKRG